MGYGQRNLLNVVHSVNCLLGVILAGKANEAEAAAATGITVLDNNLWTGQQMGCNRKWPRPPRKKMTFFSRSEMGQNVSFVAGWMNE